MKNPLVSEFPPEQVILNVRDFKDYLFSVPDDTKLYVLRSNRKLSRIEGVRVRTATKVGDMIILFAQ